MYLHSRDVAKFGFFVGLAAIFVDASIAHGLFWDNDPYWTYWITKTFLITTVFTIGTAFFGAGIRQGVAISVVHTLILEIYYQWLAPVGLPQEPEWLDFNHLWTTGFPAHFLAILGGYLIALWLLRRNRVPSLADRAADTYEDPRSNVLLALAGAAVVLILDGLITQGILLRHFPGITYYVQHLLIGFVLLFFWSSYVGFDTRGWLVVSVILALVWTTYSLYLGPVDLPLHPPRYLGYGDLWTKAFPGATVSALIGLWLTSRFVRPMVSRFDSDNGRRPVARRQIRTVATGVALLLVLPSLGSAQDGMPASASVSGNGQLITGPNPVDISHGQPMTGMMQVSVMEMGNRWSHVQNTDSVSVVADFSSGGSKYHVVANRPMPRHPFGKYTTWSGVVFRHEMHGKTGIGTDKLPKMKPDIGLWAWAEVTKDGAVISRLAPTHVMITTSGPMRGAMLEIDTEDKALVGVPDGYLTAVWPAIDTISMPESQMRIRMLLGWLALAAIVVVFGLLAAREGRSTRSA
jgi:hypothetical protein